VPSYATATGLERSRYQPPCTTPESLAHLTARVGRAMLVIESRAVIELRVTPCKILAERDEV
jgi:hypothetical protein